MIPIKNAPEIAKRIWAQEKLPVVFRPKEGELAVKLPYHEDNRIWLKGNGRRRPKWHPKGKYWTVPASWYQRILQQSLDRFGAAYTIRPGRKITKCAPACMNAKGPDCECSCEGQNHGKGVDPRRRWNVINESLAVSWGPETLRCTFLVAPRGGAIDQRTATMAARLIADHR